MSNSKNQQQKKATDKKVRPHLAPVAKAGRRAGSVNTISAKELELIRQADILDATKKAKEHFMGTGCSYLVLKDWVMRAYPKLYVQVMESLPSAYQLIIERDRFNAWVIARKAEKQLHNIWDAENIGHKVLASKLGEES